jgi:predicted aldo/keto reductase-like oxidoreductase
MQYRKDVKSGNNLSVLGFGCMRFPKSFGAIDMKKTESLVMTAIDKGINYFDTARIYPGVEEALGAILANNNAREKVFVSSKLPTWTSRTMEDIDKHFNLTLEKLKTNYIDYYFMHMLSELSTWEKLKQSGIEEWIAKKKREGQIRQICFSFHGIREQFLSILNVYDWDAALIQYNYSNENYQAGITGLKAAHDKGIPVLIMEPLLGGRLVTNLPRGVTGAFKKTRPEWSSAAWGLNWLWDQSEITTVLSGMNEMEQLEDNIAIAEKAAVGSLTEIEKNTFAEVRAIFNNVYKIKCTGCGYCLPCPKDVNIPECFTAYNISYAVNYYKGLRQYLQSVSFTAKNMRNAGKCVACGKCENHCPQSLPIRDNLKFVRKRLEPLWYWIPLTIARKFLST